MPADRCDHCPLASPWPRWVAWFLLISGVLSLLWIQRQEVRREHQNRDVLARQVSEYEQSIKSLRVTIEGVDRRERLIRAVMLSRGWTEDQIDAIAAGVEEPPAILDPAVITQSVSDAVSLCLEDLAESVRMIQSLVEASMECAGFTPQQIEEIRRKPIPDTLESNP